MQNNNYIDIWQRLGCDPVPMDMAEAFTAMQQGAIDGQDNPAIFCISNNIPEVNKYFSPINLYLLLHPGYYEHCRLGFPKL